ncbi:hypothetical protein C7H19_19810 [Aphanothece hegewaldii CCALA 016]|uniref:Uncharacterized protein n=2 Tax=Aphanothece TaxID=1121 RepID=A0A2T1LTG6_9CHRO|nr:hypothetical protein C7H19_19810 [Aphanothece hegewaldii CCALA 016]
MLWLPTGNEKMDEQTINNFLISRQALEDFLDLKITPQEYIDTLDGCDLKIDDYLDDVSFNLQNL